MMFVDFQHEGRPAVRCLFGAGQVLEAYSSYRSEIAPRPGARLGSPVGARQKWAEQGVCTMCTPWASDRVVLVPDWAGLRDVFGGVADFRGLEPGSSPTSGTSSLFRGFWCFFACTLCTLLPLICVSGLWVPDGLFACVGTAVYGGTALWWLWWAFILVSPFRWVFAFTTSWWLGALTT